MEFKNITVHARADILFGGRVVRYNCILPDGEMMALGIVFPGTFHAFIMDAGAFEVTDGCVEITIDGSLNSKSYATGDHLVLPGDHGVTVTVKDLPCQFIGKRDNSSVPSKS
jgi:uncharacterized protein YaiE (UPF0345 family)